MREVKSTFEENGWKFLPCFDLAAVIGRLVRRQGDGENEEEKKKVPIWLTITPTAAVKHVGTTVVSLLAQQRERKREEQCGRGMDSLERSSCQAIGALRKSDSASSSSFFFFFSTYGRSPRQRIRPGLIKAS